MLDEKAKTQAWSVLGAELSTLDIFLQDQDLTITSACSSPCLPLLQPSCQARGPGLQGGDLGQWMQWLEELLVEMEQEVNVPPQRWSHPWGAWARGKCELRPEWFPSPFPGPEPSIAHAHTLYTAIALSV